MRVQMREAESSWRRVLTATRGSSVLRDKPGASPALRPTPTPHTNLIVDVLQGFLARGPPDLHLPARFNRWLPAGTPALPVRVGAQVGDIPLLSYNLPRAPAH